VHSVNRPVIIAAWEELLALDGACHDIAYKRIALRQVGREVHLLPLESLPDAKPREAKVGADRLALHEIEQAI